MFWEMEYSIIFRGHPVELENISQCPHPKRGALLNSAGLFCQYCPHDELQATEGKPLTVGFRYQQHATVQCFHL